MGEVYRARDAKLERDIALKILPPELANNNEALRRFEQEARAASALNHPNIVTIYDIGQSDGVTWIAMELSDGDELRELIERGSGINAGNGNGAPRPGAHPSPYAQGRPVGVRPGTR